MKSGASLRFLYFLRVGNTPAKTVRGTVFAGLRVETGPEHLAEFE